MPEWITNGRRESYNPGLDGKKPKLKLYWNDGRSSKYEGDAALANYSGPEGQKFREEHPALAIKFKRNGPADPRDSFAHKLGVGARDALRSGNSFYKYYMSHGPVAGGAAGGLAGYLGGALANVLSDAATDKLGYGERPMDYSWVGTALGTLIGAYIGHKHKENPELKGLLKSSAMFVDPRNFILEKLQSANDVSASDKVKLAAAVRRMDKYQADRLARQLRSILGFGVGNVIARALGLSLGGALFSGIVGVIGSGMLSSARNNQQNYAKLFL